MGVQMQSMVAWRSRAKVAIALGVAIIIVVGAYAVFRLGVVGLAQSGCRGGGCEDSLNAERDHYRRLLDVALFAGGGLVTTGIIAVVALKKRLAQAAAATARHRRDADI
jgi:hypothetical protein